MWLRSSDTVNLEIRIKIHIIKVLPDILFFIAEKKYNHALVDFDFGQVYFVWWLSYSQGGEKISVEPWYICKIQVGYFLEFFML